ncbi:TadE/TadG family type IV pilus assembly protein [Sandaracinus amylolyticus]|uniref:TadE/TadG family type IV pilus assembly protein n=1 Tax=Sandaracinus amylolyticus TaxID=927083 RepID=UPI001F173AC2|nr:hypothetical protein [Sandaracinus amylolyticus]UJR82148.1 Hypothetical protein I5071_42130 [Sandaracinus amylolyticus]
MTTSTRRARSLLRDTRGAAYAEVVLMMPVFISLFAGIGFFHHFYMARMDAAAEARRCAWAYANGGCDQVPAGCEGVVGGAGGGAESRTSRPEVNSGIADAREGVAQMDRDMPLSASRRIYEAILGSSTTARGSESVPMPDWVGGGSRDARCGYTVVCNEREQTLGGLIREAFCNKANDIGVGGALGC